MYYDTELKKINAKFPKQKILTNLSSGNQVFLKIYTQNRRALLEYESIRTYSHDTYFSTEDKTIVLTNPSKNYVFDLESNDKIIQTWTVSMLSEEYPFIIFDENGKKIDKEKIFDTNRIIFVFNDSFTVEPSELIEGKNIYLIDGLIIKAVILI